MHARYGEPNGFTANAQFVDANWQTGGSNLVFPAPPRRVRLSSWSIRRCAWRLTVARPRGQAPRGVKFPFLGTSGVRTGAQRLTPALAVLGRQRVSAGLHVLGQRLGWSRTVHTDGEADAEGAILMAGHGRKRWMMLAGGAILTVALAGCGTGSGGPSAANSSAPSSHAAPSSGSGAGATTSWMSYQSSTKTATLKLVAGYNSSQSGFNFNGYSNGQMVVTVPTGWKVTVDFSNQGQLPHSAAVVTTASSQSPAFPGAGLPASELVAGIASGQTATFSFTTGAPGDYRIACLVPGHEGLGMWDTLKVTSGGTPSVKT